MYLLIQFRKDASGWHEYKCVYEATGLDYHKFRQVNVSSEFLTQEHLKELMVEAQAVFIGGLAELHYDEIDPKRKHEFDTIRNKILPVIQEVLAEKPDIKMLGFCFGHQLIADALGAKVGQSEEQTEVGLGRILLNEEGQKDPLFAGFEKEFPAILGHRDAVLTLPEKATLLASSTKCPIQAFRYGKHIYGVQFHPELENDDLQWRLNFGSNAAYKKKSNIAEEKVIVPTRQVMKNFIELV